MCTEAPAVSPVSPSVENIYEQIREGIKELEVVIKRWPQYLVPLEMVSIIYHIIYTHFSICTKPI